MFNIDKASIANVIAGTVIISGIASVFLQLPNSEMMMILVGAGIGYLFKNGNINVLGLKEKEK